MLQSGWRYQPPMITHFFSATSFLILGILLFCEIINEQSFVENFGGLNLENSLKKLPIGFDKDFDFNEIGKRMPYRTPEEFFENAKANSHS